MLQCHTLLMKRVITLHSEPASVDLKGEAKEWVPGMGFENDPGPHSVHAVSPAEPEYCPGGHITHAVAPTTLEKLLVVGRIR